MNKLQNIIVALIIGLAVAIAVIAFNNPTGNPVVGTGNAISVGVNPPANSLYIAGSTGNVGVGTTNPLQKFQVNDTATAAFVVTSAGQVGIGTTNPSAILDVAGPIKSKNIVRKTVLESTWSSTLQDDNHLKFYMEANKTYQFEFLVFASHHATPDIKYSINGPPGPGFLRAHTEEVIEGTGGHNIFSGLITAYNTEIGFNWDSSYNVAITIKGVVGNGSTAGNLVLRWSQRTESSSFTATVYPNSYVLYREI